eukprot:15446631-Alexandrium_andersonii.AAC.1
MQWPGCKCAGAPPSRPLPVAGTPEKRVHNSQPRACAHSLAPSARPRYPSEGTADGEEPRGA